MAVEDEEIKEEELDPKEAKRKKKEEKKAKKKAKGEEGDDLLNEEEETTGGGKVAVFFVTLVIIAIWVAIIVLLIKWDVGGFGSTVLSPLLKNVPYVNKILPETDLDYATEDTEYTYATLNDAIDRIKELEIELAEAQSKGSASDASIAELQGQITELEQYKQNEANFEKQKEQFYEEVVFGDNAPSIEEYKAYYESIDPANAEILYKQVVEQLQEDEELESYVNTYSSMKPKEAAAIFNTMTDNLQLVADILMQMDTQSRADILGKMNSDTAAMVTKIMQP